MGSEGLPERSEGLPGGPGGEGWTCGRMDVRMDGQNFSPFYRTLSPVRAAAQKIIKGKISYNNSQNN